ncbi:hypothetical protein HYD97_04020 [Mycoplasmopsis bovis]|nr:hypothetical protein [Mycoplasmopsis bovis]QQH34530.1 hypothetical protein HYD97_04020 [Mycoplasmopsis bovis]
MKKKTLTKTGETRPQLTDSASQKAPVIGWRTIRQTHKKQEHIRKFE